LLKELRGFPRDSRQNLLFCSTGFFMQESPISSQGYQGYKLPSRSLLANLLIAFLTTGLVVWSFQLIRDRVMSVTSEDAVINGSLTDIKAPETGVVSQLPVNTGDTSTLGKPLFKLQNVRVSQLQAQSMQTKLSQQKLQLERAEVQLNQQIRLLETASTDKNAQYDLENVEAQQFVERIASDLRGAEARYRLAQLNHQRFQFLRAEGAIAQANLDTATIELEQRRAEADSLRNQLEAMQANRQAVQAGLTLTRTRSSSDPRLRLEELQMQIADQRQVVETLKQSIRDAEAELAQATTDLENQQAAVVSAPAQGVIWRLVVKEGTFVKQGEHLGQMLDCSKRWVDAFVDEQALRSLQPGTPATITLYGADAKVLQGRVSMIRPGSGRLTAGEDIAAIPAAANLPRKAQVRVELDPSSDRGGSGMFCYVGYTGRVNFQVR
jgi:multidrug resistance efflux pump